jgi:hypothetical protein
MSKTEENFVLSDEPVGNVVPVDIGLAGRLRSVDAALVFAYLREETLGAGWEQFRNGPDGRYSFAGSGKTVMRAETDGDGWFIVSSTDAATDLTIGVRRFMRAVGVLKRRRILISGPATIGTIRFTYDETTIKKFLQP